MASKQSMADELRVIKRGQYYMTPFMAHHIEEFIRVIHPENVKELRLLGYENVREALDEMIEASECYLVRGPDNQIVFVGGLFFGEGEPQLFALFSTNLRENFTALARGSKMLLSFFDQTYPMLSMSIMAKYEAMVNWALFLGFDPVGVARVDNLDFVEFVRCNPNKNYVSHETSRPVMH